MATRLQLLIDGDATGATKALKSTSAAVDDVDSKLGRFNTGMRNAAAPAAAVTAGLALVGKQAFDSASALEQSAGAVESVFGTYATQVQQQADAAAQNVGLAESQYNDLAAVLGAQLGNMGVAQDQLAGQTGNLIGLGADLAATFGGPTSDAVDALSSLLRGERDPIERYGVSIRAADVEARKAAMGLTGLTGEADAAATTQATLALLMDQTAAAQGAFGREADTAAGQQQRATASWEDAKAALGAGLLPVVTAAAAALSGFSQWAQENAGVLTALAVVVGVIAGAVLAYNGIMAVVPVVQGIATAAQWAWNAAMSANPIGIIILAIGALIAIIVLVVQHWDTIKAVGLAAWDAIAGAVQGFVDAWLARVKAIGDAGTKLWNLLQAGAKKVIDWIVNGIKGFADEWLARVNAIGAAASKLWSLIEAGAKAMFAWLVKTVAKIPDDFRRGFDKARDWVTGIVDGMWSKLAGFIDKIAGIPRRIMSALSNVQLPSWVSRLTGVLGFSQSGASGYFVASTMTAASWTLPQVAPSTATSRDGVTIQINVSGALDPRAVARQIRDILNTDARVRGIVDLAGVVVA